MMVGLTIHPPSYAFPHYVCPCAQPLRHPPTLSAEGPDRPRGSRTLAPLDPTVQTTETFSPATRSGSAHAWQLRTAEQPPGAGTGKSANSHTPEISLRGLRSDLCHRETFRASRD